VPKKSPSAGPPPLTDRRVWRFAAGCRLLVGPQVRLASYIVMFLTEQRRGSLLAASALTLAILQLAGVLARRTSHLFRSREFLAT
jgi:hypothetical protein